jgi:hypothetical protein
MTQTTNRGPVEPEHQYPDAPETRRMIYMAIGVVLLLLLIIGLITWRGAESNDEANAKADQFIAELTAAGLPVPTKDVVVRVLGDDGGAVCADPANYLKVALARNSLSNGAAGPGQRPIIGPRQMVDAEALAIKVYCPDQADEYAEFVNSHTYADLIKE